VPFVWGVILTLSTWPYYQVLTGWLGGRRGLAAVVLTLSLLLIFVVPTMLALSAAADNLPSVDSLLEKLGALKTGRPPRWVVEIPLIGDRLDGYWRSGKLSAWLDLEKLRPALAQVGGWVLRQGANLAVTAFHVVLATVIGGLLYTHGEQAAAVVQRLALRIGGARTLNALHVAARTVPGVALGIIGTALIQSVLSGIGFAVAAVPGAAALGLVCFFAAVLQLGTGIIWIPVAIWLGYQESHGWAIFTVVWGVIVNTLDNFTKPYFIGRSSPLPFLLILVGVIGGLLAWGFVGIFLGTTLLAVAYTVFFDWLDSRESSGQDRVDPD
jgi:predicted PurR-regulated permease PerM